MRATDRLRVLAIVGAIGAACSSAPPSGGSGQNSPPSPDGAGGQAGRPAYVDPGTVSVDPAVPGTPGGECVTGAPCAASLCSALGYCVAPPADLPPMVQRVVPPPGAGAVPPSSPIVFFLDRAYADDALHVQVTATQAGVTYDVTDRIATARLSLAGQRQALVLASTEGLPMASSVIVRLSGAFAASVSFATAPSRPAPNGVAPGFERPDEPSGSSGQSGASGAAGSSDPGGAAGEPGGVGNGAGGGLDAGGAASGEAGAAGSDAGGAAGSEGPGGATAAGAAGQGGAALSAVPSEELWVGWAGVGDVGVVVDRAGGVYPLEGHRYGALSTGRAVRGLAVGGLASVMTCGNMDVPDGGVVSFGHRFLSTEACGPPRAAYDDTFLAVAMGPLGIEARVLATSSGLCADGAPAGQFPGLPDGGTSVRDSGWQTASFGAALGSPVRLGFVVVDLGDDRLTSLGAVDGVRVTK